MYSCQFKAGEIVLRVETPEKLDVKEPYSLFLCENDKADITVRFSYTENISAENITFFCKSDMYNVSEDSEYMYFYYHMHSDNECYALRKVAKNDKTRHDIYIPEKFRGMIWTRLVFSLINFDDVASQFGASVFHSSVIEHNNEAILFTAPCGTGKSTQADLWAKYRNAEIINGDKALIYEKDGVCYVSGLPFSGSSNICKNKILPVKAVVRLSQSKENIIERLSGINAYKAVFEGCYHSQWSSEYNTATTLIAEKIVSAVPIVSLACLPDESAVETLEKYLSSL